MTEYETTSKKIEARVDKFSKLYAAYANDIIKYKEETNASFASIESEIKDLYEIIKKQIDDTNSSFSALYEKIDQYKKINSSPYVDHTKQIEQQLEDYHKDNTDNIDDLQKKCSI